MTLNHFNYALASMAIAASTSACTLEELPGDETEVEELEAVVLPEQPDALASLGSDPEMDPTEAESADLVEDGNHVLASPGYPYYQYEGLYPTQTPCSGRYYRPQVSGGATKTVIRNGRTITLKYYYHGSCGSHARIENAPSGECWAYLDRSNDGGRTWANVTEPVDPGISYAYTKVGNNLNGRVSRAALVCRGSGSTFLVLARTSWY